MELLLTFIYTAFFLGVIFKWRFFKNGLPGSKASALLFAVKVLAGCGAGLVYTYYYTDRHTADTFRLFDDSAVIFNLMKQSPLDFFRVMTGIDGQAAHLVPVYNQMNNWYDIYSPINDNRFMIRLNTLIRFFSLGHYYVHVVFVAFLSTIGIIGLIRFTRQALPELSVTLFLLIGFLPSVLFWGSGLMKDAIVIFSMGVVLYLFKKYIIAAGQIKIRHWLLFLIALVLLAYSRFQMFVILMPSILAWYLVIKYKLKTAITFILVNLLFVLAAGLLPLVQPEWNLPLLLHAKQQSFISLASEQHAGSLITNIQFEPTLSGVLLKLPQAFITCLVRPFITDLENPLMILSAIENLLLLLFGAFCIFKSAIKSASQQPEFYFLLFTILISFALIGLVTPVLGAMVRYKAPSLIFLIFLYLIILKPSVRVSLESIFKKRYPGAAK